MKCPECNGIKMVIRSCVGCEENCHTASCPEIICPTCEGTGKVPDQDNERKYPCAECGKQRSKSEGGIIFTVCDECWDKLHKKPNPTAEEKAVEIIADGLVSAWNREPIENETLKDSARQLLARLKSDCGMRFE